MPLRGQNADPRMTRRNESLCIVTRDSEETYLLGKLLGEALRKGDVLALRGDLGSGKTVLTQGIAHGMGVHCNYAVTSPTFTLVNEYPGRQMTLYHWDL